jgi:hypothetical protein
VQLSLLLEFLFKVEKLFVVVGRVGADLFDL